jgi:dihydrolipoamide dehydrogenase
MSDAFDVVFVGAGPGGYVGAIRCAQLGLKTAVIEKDKTLGGTCLNVGCIPSKALLESSEIFHAAGHSHADHGVVVKEPKLDLKTMLGRKDKIVSDLTGGIEFLFKKNNITWIKGAGKLLSNTKIKVTGSDGKSQDVEAKNIVLATGSVPNSPPSLKIDGKKIVTSTEALSFNDVPEHMIVIGGGAIGLEMGSVWLRLGAKVTVIEYNSKICGTADLGMSKRMLAILKKQGMEFILEASVTGAEVGKKNVKVSYTENATKVAKSIEGDMVLVATGRKAFSDGLGLEDVGIQKNERGVVLVNEHYQTKFPNVYAIGDLIPGPMLAHKAEEEGVAVAEIIAGQAGHVNYDTVPNVIYTWPEMASVGKTEEELKAAGIAYKAGAFPFTPNARAKAGGMTEGQIKILADATTDKVLGVHIVGPKASELIAEAVIAMEFSASAEDIARSFHAHPTLSEVMREAALAVDKRQRQM